MPTPATPVGVVPGSGGERSDGATRPAAARLTTAVGMGALALGTTVLARLVWRYGADMGWDGSGSRLRHPAVALLLCATATVAVVLAGATMVLGRRSRRGPFERAVIAVTAAVGALVPLTLTAYPHNRSATLTSAEAPGWSVRLPLTEVLGYRSRSDTHIVLEGRADGRHCSSVLRAVTLDLADGTVLEVRSLPTLYPDESHVPPPPLPLDAIRFRVDQGSSAVVCSS
ncbi:MAG TPA: hypothetical protein VHM89_12950 [Acidimicrobiales bacterium]|nr:hypothetical protein [Acidimicrobiales bacterium]